MLLQGWERRWKGKTLRVKNPSNGRTLDALVLDTCSNSDCHGCCTRNANEHGGMLIDFELHTAKRFWGEGAADTLAAVEWQELAVEESDA